jgi:hypothetical protein
MPAGVANQLVRTLADVLIKAAQSFEPAPVGQRLNEGVQDRKGRRALRREIRIPVRLPVCREVVDPHHVILGVVTEPLRHFMMQDRVDVFY